MSATAVKPSNKMLPPGPKPKIAALNLVSLRRNPVQFLTNLTREYGDIAYLKLGSQGVVLLNNPEYIKDVLVTHQRSFKKGQGLEKAKKVLGEGLLTSEGEFHIRQRRMAQPAFHRQRIAAYADVMTDYAARTSQRWETFINGRMSQIDMDQEMMRLTLAIVGKTLFDADVENEADEIGDALTSMLMVFNLMTLPFGDLIEKLPLPKVKKAREGAIRVDETIYRIIRERRKTNEDRGDLLSMLLLAQDEEGDGTGMTDQQVRDEALTLFLAGHETTANALTWTWYLLSQNPDVEQKLHKEIDTVLAGKLPTFEDVARLPYTKMVLSESMRLYPPAWMIGRRALVDYEVGGYTLPARTIVLMSPYITQHDPRYFFEPNKFDPERWTAEAQAKRPKFSYYPFGGGSRLCIGESFAWMEGALLLATLAQKWKARLLPGHPVAVQPIVTLRPKHGMKMILEGR